MANSIPAAFGITGAVQAEGALAQGKMTSQSLNAQAGIQLQQAQEAEDAGHYNAYRQGLIADQKIGAATAAYGASGVETTSGSALNVIQNSAQNAELDRQQILHQADLKAINYQNQAAMDAYGAESALRGSYLNAASAVLGGSANAVSSATSGAGGNGGGGGTDTTPTSSTTLSDETTASGAENAAIT